MPKCQAFSNKAPDSLLLTLASTILEFCLKKPDMAWRNQGITGSNNIPLGARRRFGGGDSAPPPDDGGYNPSQPSAGFADGGFKRGRSPERGLSSHLSEAQAKTDILKAQPVDGGERRRKKRNRWGDAAENKALA